MAAIDFDIVIVGAGISGIGLACRLQQWCPDKTFVLLENKAKMGGTWEQFKYPGVRSDSDLHTFGYPFRPWTLTDSIAKGDAILRYLNETANEFGIDKKMRFGRKVVAADWTTSSKTWDLTVCTPTGQEHLTTCFVIFCTGYYDHDRALVTTPIPGIEDFKGRVVQPQFWPDHLDYKDKHVVIIGSGATAITLLPALAKSAARVTQLQRSPSYVVAQPQDDLLNRLLRLFLPVSLCAKVIRFKFFFLPWLFYKFATTFPTLARKGIKSSAAKLLPPGYSMDPNFEPTYDPWSQRMCLSPEGDYFAAIRAGNADIVTATIEKVTSDSIVLADSDKVLKPDIIVTATGLRVLMAGGIEVTVDGQEFKIPDKYMYRGVMLQDLPNAAFAIGYTNASWTLGADVAAHFMTRLINHMSQKGLGVCVPRVSPHVVLQDRPILNFNSTYIKKAIGDMPKAAAQWPWRPKTMYLRDLLDAKLWSFQDLHFG